MSNYSLTIRLIAIDSNRPVPSATVQACDKYLFKDDALALENHR